MTSLDYRSIKDIYDTLHDAGVVKESLPEWSAKQNQLTNSDLYSAGLHDNVIKRFSVGLDRFLEETGLPKVTRTFGGEVGGLVGAPEVGASIGEKLPRTAVNLASFAIPGAGWANAARLGIAGLLSGAEAYTESGSPVAGLVSAGTTAALPGVAGYGERLAAKALGSRLVEGPLADAAGNVTGNISRFYPETATQKVGTFLGGQVAAVGFMEGTQAVQAVAAGETPRNPLSVENLLNLTLGQTPFALLHGATKVFGKVPPSADTVQHAVDESAKRIEQKRIQDEAPAPPPTFEPPTPEVVKETRLRLAQLRGEQIQLDPTNVEEANRLLQQEHEVLKQHVPTPDSVLGDSIQPDAPRQQVIGHELKSTGKWRAVLVSNAPVNPEELRGKVVTYSTAYEPTPTARSTGDSVFGLPDPQWRTIKTQEEWNGRGKPVTNQPDLPVQANPATDEQIFSHLQDLKKVEIDTDLAQTPADLQKAVVRLQGVQHENDIPPTNDASIRKVVERLVNSGADPKDIVKVAVKIEAKRTARKLEATRERERAAPPLTEKEAAHVSALMGEGGFSIVTADKLSHSVEDVAKLPEETSQPLHNSVEEAAYTVTNPDVKSKPEDVQMFRTLVGELGKLSDIGPTEIEDVAQFISDRDGTPLPEVKDEIKHFLTQPHVAEWSRKLEEQVAKIREENSGPGVVRPPPGERLVTVQKADGTTFQASFADKYYEGGRASIARLTPEGKWSHTVLGEGDKIIEPQKTGVGWLFSLAPYDPVRNLLGGKHTLPKSGEVQESVFRNIGGTQRKPLTSAEIELYRSIVPEAFEGTMVNVPKLVRGLEENGPTIEVRKLGGEQQTETNRRWEVANHELETRSLTVEFNDANDSYYLARGDRPLPENELTPQLQQWLDEASTTDRGTPTAGARYSFLGPKPESDMPGYVEGLIRLPSHEPQKGEVDTGGKAIKYMGPHFGGEDRNVLAFFRGYEETLPNGTKAFHVIEVQSDWGQARRKSETTNVVRRRQVADDDTDLPQEARNRWFNEYKVADHPLLKVYESLALKAAIQHAKEVGATKVILSDAETAMMTEGQDRMLPIDEGPVAGMGSSDRSYAEQVAREQTERTGTIHTVEDEDPVAGGFWRVRSTGKLAIKQEKGMRLHYDQTLPSSMEKLTGEKGTPTELGTHKNANQVVPGERRTDGAGGLVESTVGSPVFKDTAGKPKTQITGRVYDISHLPSDFTLTEPNRAPNFEPFVPETPQDIATVESLGLDRGGVGLHDFLKNSKNPVVKALYEGLKPFTDALGRIEVIIGETKHGNSQALDLGNGKTRIVISPATLDSPVKDFSIAHELVHGLTISELNNPTKADLVRQFDDMRQRLIESLPKDQQARLNELVKTEWMGKYGRSEVDYDTILPGGTAFDQQKLYGLLNTKEMVAQGLSSRQMQSFMRSVKAEKGSWFSKFTDTVKRLLGLNVDGTFFDEFLTKTNMLLEHGDYVASFRDFTTRYFENLGLSDNLAAVQTRRALGLVIDSGFGTSREDIVARLGNDIGRSPELNAAMRDLNRALDTQSESRPEIEQLMGELGYEPSVKGFDDFVHEALNDRVPNHSDALDLMPTEAAGYVFAKVKDMQNVLNAVRAATAEANKGLINLADPGALRGPIKEALQAVEKVMTAQRAAEERVQIANDLQAFMPDVYLDRVLAEPDSAPGKPDEEKLGWLKKSFGTAAQLSRSDPALAEYFEKGFNISRNVRDMHRRIIKVMGVDVKSKDSNLTKAGLEESVKAILGPRAYDALNRYMYWDNKVAKDEGRGVTMLPQDHPEITKILQKLTAAERDAVVTTRAKTSLMTQQGHIEDLNARAEYSVSRAAMLVLQDAGMSPVKATQAAGNLWKATELYSTKDPTQKQEADALVNLVQSQMSPQGFLDLVKFTQNAVNQHNLFKQLYVENPAWATAQRQERWLIEYRRGGKLVQDQGSSRKEVLTKAQGAKIVKEPWDQYEKSGEDQYVPQAISEEAFQRLKELEQNQLRMLSSKMTPEQLAEVERTSYTTQFAREQVAQQGAIPNFEAPARLLSKGADELPWLWNHVSWAERMSTYWTRQRFRAQADLHLADPAIQDRSDYLNIIRQHRDNSLSNDPRVIEQINKFTTTWYLSSLASPIINGSQTIMTLVPELTRLNGGRMLDSYRRLGSAIKEIADNGVLRKGWKDPETKNLVEKAIQDGEIDQSMWDEDAATNDSIGTRWKQLMSKHKVQTVGQRADSLLGATMSAGLWLFKQPEKFNRYTALIAGYKLARDNGMSIPDASTEAYRLNRAVNYGGGKVNRPVGVFNKLPKSLALLGTNLQGYNIGVVSQLTRYIQDGFFKPDLKPSEVYAARKAGTQMLGTVLTLAGGLGMPFAASAVALLNQAFPGLETSKHIREWTRQLFGEDNENGNVLTDIALTGLPSMLGWDMQSRLSMGNLVPGVSELNGFQPELLAGPPLGLAYNFLNGAGRVLAGDPKGGESFVPPGVKKLFQYVTNDQKIKDYKERPLFTPTIGETAGIALGFQPKRLSDFNAAQRILEQNRTVTSRRESQFHQTQAEDVLRGNFGTVRQTLLQRQQQDTSYDLHSAVRSISQSAEELTFPRDLRREGTTRTAPERSRLLSAFNLPSAEPSEVDRANFRLQVEQRLGLRVDPRRTLRVAQMVDELARQNPTATRSELRRKVESTLSRSPQSASLLQELQQ